MNETSVLFDFGRYEIGEVLSTAPTGITQSWKITRRADGAKLVLRTLPPETDTALVTGWYRTKLPCCVEIEDLIFDTSPPHLVRRWIASPNLRELLEAHRDQFTPREVRFLFCEIAKALETIHDLAANHGALKPANIFVHQGAVLFTDPNVVTLSPDRPTGTARSTYAAAMGEPVYTTPEHIKEQILGPDSDLYTLGVILYEWLAGVPPFREDHFVLTCSMHISSPVPSIARFNPAVDPDLEQLVMRMLAKERGARPESISSVIEELGQGQDFAGLTLSQLFGQESAESHPVAARPAFRHKGPYEETDPLEPADPSPSGEAKPTLRAAAGPIATKPKAIQPPAPSAPTPPSVESPSSRDSSNGSSAPDRPVLSPTKTVPQSAVAAALAGTSLQGSSVAAAAAPDMPNEASKRPGVSRRELNKALSGPDIKPAAGAGTTVAPKAPPPPAHASKPATPKPPTSPVPNARVVAILYLVIAVLFVYAVAMTTYLIKLRAE